MRHPALSPAEHLVMLLVAEGLTNDEIAHRLGRAPSTIKHHRDAAREALEAPNLPAAIALFREWLVRAELASDYTRKPTRDRRGRFQGAATPAGQMEMIG